MQSTRGFVIIMVLISGALGCKRPNPDRCVGAPNCQPDSHEGELCGEIKCPTSKPVCELDTKTCVECLEDKDCLSAVPNCSPQYQCLQCVNHDDCMDSKLCLVGNICAAREDVTYVGGPGASATNTSCLVDAPCADLGQALSLAGLRKYIKVTGLAVRAGESVLDKKITIYGDQGVLANSVAGKVLSITNAADVTLIDLEIAGNSGASNKACVDIGFSASVTMTRVSIHHHGQAGIGLAATAKLVMIDSQVHDNALEGVNATGGTLEIRHSSVYGNKGVAGVATMNAIMVTIDSSLITANNGTAGGVSINTGPFAIRNSIIAKNGTASTTAGLALSSTNGVVDFSTIANNVSDIGGNAGVSCAGTVNISNSILTGNNSTVPVSPSCNVAYSLTSTSPPALPGVGNMTGDPTFLNTIDRLNPSFFRIGSTSAARGNANSTSTVDVDIDGQKRDSGDGTKDMGAAEYKP